MALCELLIPYPPEAYVQALMTNEARLFQTNNYLEWQTVRSLPELGGCGHYRVGIKVGDETRTMIPCFFTEDKAVEFLTKCSQFMYALLERDGRNPIKYHPN
jgi:hypothetical protein